ncbi:TRAP transporter permease [uncultured Mailhella sp.]|uniref:TRAP transporter permease n=1 Tax=uncultured Mailhella sp. TaxID=1981031 RepID=UPI0025F614FD|nr:TRAP transporter permease [uncultured Mailhella sp.]
MTFSRKSVAPIASVVAVVLTLFQIYSTGGFGVLPTPIQRGTHLALIMTLVFLWRPAFRYKDGKEPLPMFLLDLCLAVLALAIGAYIIMENDYIMDRLRYVDPLTDMDWFMGVSCVLLVLEITRRTAGLPLVIVSVVFILYAFFGQYLPGGLRHNGIYTPDLLEQLFLTTDGIYGVPLAAAAGMIYAFVMFGAFLEKANMSSLFMDLACLLTRRSQGGPAKVAIFASALFGTISGSAPANVYGTGTFTIPLMKRVGYAPAFAGAVEAVASTGGQMMPPIMGAAAFIMADLIGVSYLEIAKAALLPSLLYYLALLAMIHFEAVNKNIGRLPEEQIPSTRSVMIRMYYLLPLVVLVAVMLMGRSVVSCALIGIVTILVLSVFRDETRFNLKRLAGALEQAARNALMISSCCACAGIVVAVIALTGVGYKFINFVTMLAGDSLLLLMICLMITSMILGMGVPTSPAYIIVAALGAPALVKAGVPVIAAHMFVFYYAILSAITPPVCVASFSGAAIAEANAMKTGWVSVKLGIVAFIIPFMFAYQPALMLQGDALTVGRAVVTSIVGVLALSGGMQGYFVSRCRGWERILLAAGGLMLIDSGSMTDVVGVAILVGVGALQWIRRKNTVAAA